MTHKGARKREAPFVHLNETTAPSVSEGDGGVTNQSDPSIELGVFAVENEDREINADLGAGKSRAIRCRIRREHVGEQ